MTSPLCPSCGKNHWTIEGCGPVAPDLAEMVETAREAAGLAEIETLADSAREASEAALLPHHLRPLFTPVPVTPDYVAVVQPSAQKPKFDRKAYMREYKRKQREKKEAAK